MKSEHAKRLTRFTIDDVTMIVGVRAHEQNLWVLERLEILVAHYQPQPKVIVVDFGSQAPYRHRIAEVCTQEDMRYLYVDDTGVFSAASARNHGASAATTELLFFNDIDCFGEADLIGRSLQLANAISLGTDTKQMINLPAYHLGVERSADILTDKTAGQRAHKLSEAFAAASYAARSEVADFVAGYSNVFLVQREFFSLTGGFNESFRGHGSEDFEYLLRFAWISQRFPMPEELLADRYAPNNPSYYDKGKSYLGFRRLFELMAFQAESAGLRVAHLDHPKSASDSWIRKNDWHHSKFDTQVKGLTSAPENVFSYDWLPRSKTALVATRGQDARLALSLRCQGYRLEAVQLDSKEDLAQAIARVKAGEVDAIASLEAEQSGQIFMMVAKESETERIELTTSEGRGFKEDCYAAARLGLGRPQSMADEVEAGRAKGNMERRVRKLIRDPKRYLEESRYRSLRRIGKRIL